jgi:hypothetical protein
LYARIGQAASEKQSSSSSSSKTETKATAPPKAPKDKGNVSVLEINLMRSLNTRV